MHQTASLKTVLLVDGLTHALQREALLVCPVSVYFQNIKWLCLAVQGLLTVLTKGGFA